MPTKTKYGSDIKPGDVVIFLGTPHLIERIDPPTEATLKLPPDVPWLRHGERRLGHQHQLTSALEVA